MAREKILKGKPTRLYHDEESGKALRGLRALFSKEEGKRLADAEVCRRVLKDRWAEEKS